MYIFRIQFLPVNHCFQWQSIIYEEDNADVDIAINWAQFATWEKESNCKKGLWYYLNKVELQNLDTYCYTANIHSQNSVEVHQKTPKCTSTVHLVSSMQLISRLQWKWNVNPDRVLSGTFNNSNICSVLHNIFSKYSFVYCNDVIRLWR